MLVTEGGRFGGFGFYLLKGKPVFLYNALDLKRFRWEGPTALAPGKHTVTFAFTYDGPGFGKGGTGVLSVDGKAVATQTMPHSIPFLMTIDEGFDVGTDTRTSVADTDYQPPFQLQRHTVEADGDPAATTDRERRGRRRDTQAGPGDGLKRRSAA